MVQFGGIDHDLLGLKAQAGPDGINPRLDVRVHGNGCAPFPIGFAWPLVGGVDAHFGAQSGDRAGEIQIINRHMFNQRGIPRLARYSPLSRPKSQEHR